MTEEKLNFKLEIYSGPLDLLLSLITKQKINIYDIPISDILDQYMEYMELLKQNEAEISSEFIVMACELIYIKSKMLLPQDEEEEDPRTELVISLLELSHVKRVSEYLSLRSDAYFYRYHPTPKPFVIKTQVQEYDSILLSDAIRSLKLSQKSEKEKRKKQDIQKVFAVKYVSVEEKIIYVLKRLVKSLNCGNSGSFYGMFENVKNRSEMIATFLAMLELTTSGRISFEKYGDDYIISLNTEKALNEGV